MVSDRAIAACIVTLRGGGIQIGEDKEKSIYATWRTIPNTDREMVLACRQYVLTADSQWFPPLGRIRALIPPRALEANLLESPGLRIGEDEEGLQVWMDGEKIITIGKRDFDSVTFALGILKEYNLITEEIAENALRDFSCPITSTS